MNSSQIEEILNLSTDEVQSILPTLLNVHMWNENREKLVIVAVNKLLSALKTRLQGLEFLNLIVDNCSSSTISENGINWISHCLIKHPGDYLKELKLRTIGKIVQNSNEEQEFSKKFVSDHISKIFEMCLTTHNNSYEIEAALNTLGVCMKQYGSWFAPHKLRIENYVISFLENPSEKVVENAALAFHFLQQVGGPGIDGNNHSQSFSISFDKVCATVQELYDKFFENKTEMHLIEKATQKGFEFKDLPLHTQTMLHVNARRIRNCLKFIMTMLLKGFPVVKELKPGDVINIVYRGTSSHHCLSSASAKSQEDFQFSILLHQIQIELLRLLHILIVWLNGSALPFTFIITKILIDCLNITQNCSCFQTDSLLQEMIYKTLSCWIRISRCAVHSHFQTQLIKCILKDIVPVTNSLTLNLQKDVSNKSKKAKQKIIQEKIISSGQPNTSAKELTNAEIITREKKCQYGLDTLKHVLLGTVLKVKPNVLEELYTSILNILTDIQISKVHHPYTNQKCQAKLYEVLVAFYEQDSVKVLPPLQLTINILNRGLNNTDRTISLTCEHGLNIIEKICLPVCPLLLTAQAPTLKETVRDSVSLTVDTGDNHLVKKTLDETNSYASSTTEVYSSAKSNEQLEENEQRLNDQQVGKEGSCDKEIDLDRLNIADNEVASENVGEVEEEFTEAMKDNENESYYESVTSLQREPSVHIIDVKIVKSCPLSPDDLTIPEDVSTDKQNSSSSQNEGPPSKRIKIDEQEVQNCSIKKSVSESSVKVKLEIIEQFDKAQDDQGNKDSVTNVSESVKIENVVFEEGDDFVDVVKDY